MITLQIKKKNLINHINGCDGFEWRNATMHYHKMLYVKSGEIYVKKDVTKIKFICGMNKDAPTAIFQLKRFELYEFVTTGEFHGLKHIPGVFAFLFELGDLIECNFAEIKTISDENKK